MILIDIRHPNHPGQRVIVWRTYRPGASVDDMPWRAWMWAVWLWQSALPRLVHGLDRALDGLSA